MLERNQQERENCELWTIGVEDARNQQLRWEIDIWATLQPGDSGFLLLPGWLADATRLSCGVATAACRRGNFLPSMGMILVILPQRKTD